MPVHHRIYGLEVVANRPVPGLLPLPESECEPDLCIHMKDSSGFPASESSATYFYTSPYCDEAGQPALRVAAFAGGDDIGFFYGDGARFAIGRQGRELWADWPEGYSAEDAATYLLGPVLGFVLRLKGITPLHASAVAIDDRAVAFVGVGGTGKSTTAAAFAQLGFAVLSDDVVPLKDCDDEFLAVPGYPRVNLWPDAVRTLLGSADALPLITPAWGKHYLPLSESSCRFESRRLPLGALYFLGERDAALSAPVIEEVAAGDALISLVANTYVNYVLDRDMRQREFELLGRLVAGVPMRRIRAAADPARLLAMCEAIAEDARQSMNRSLVTCSTGDD